MCLRRVVEHFESSIKNKELLDEALEILESTPLNLISWCQTRMAHFLKAARVFDEMLPGVYDVMYTKDVKEDDRDILFTPKNVFILKIMSELDPLFNAHYLKKADKGDLLVSTVFDLAHSFADEMNEFSSKKADDFLDSLKFDVNGNLQASISVKGSSNKHTITLNYPHKTVRNQTQADRVNVLKEELEELKEKIVSNIVENVRDQCDESTYYYSWSGLDLELSLSMTERVKRLKDVVAIYCCDRFQTVSEYTDGKEKQTRPKLWEGFEVRLHFNKKIDATEEEFYEELNKSWETINGLFMRESNSAKHEKRSLDQGKVWRKFINCHYIEFPHVSQLIQILLASSGNTSPLERGYTHLQMIASKRRNKIDPQNLETLFLLATLNIPVKKPADYKDEIQRLASGTL